MGLILLTQQKLIVNAQVHQRELVCHNEYRLACALLFINQVKVMRENSTVV